MQLRPPRGQGSLRCLSLCLRCVASATASGTGHCPARTPPNAVPWVCPEKDTFLSGQLLVVGRRPSGSNWANEISRDEVPRARCERSAERRLREAGGGAEKGSCPWRCAVLRAMQLRLRPPRGQGSLRCLSLCLRCVASATASGTGHCPARTPPNAVPWVCPEKDTFLSGQLLVVGRRPSGSNWANEISRDEVPRARCERSAERRLREAGGGAAGGGYFWPCARYSCGAHARVFRKRSIRSLPQRRRVGNADHQSAKHFADS